MKYDDLKIIQQLAILRDMINQPQVHEFDYIPQPVFYPIKGTNYVMDVSGDNTLHRTQIKWTNEEEDVASIVFKDREWCNTPDMVMLLLQNGDITLKDDDNVIDRFGLTNTVHISRDLEGSLKQILAMLKSFDKIVSTEKTARPLIELMLSLIPIARRFPEELFNTLHIDKTTTQLLDNLNLSILSLLREQDENENIASPNLTIHGHNRYMVTFDRTMKLSLYITLGDINQPDAVSMEWGYRNTHGDLCHFRLQDIMNPLETCEQIADKLQEAIAESEHREHLTILLNYFLSFYIDASEHVGSLLKEQGAI